MYSFITFGVTVFLSILIHTACAHRYMGIIAMDEDQNPLAKSIHNRWGMAVGFETSTLIIWFLVLIGWLVFG